MPYDVIYADPAWPYRNLKTGGSHKSGAAQKYPTMTLDDIIAMPVKDIAAKNALCFLWGTVPLGDDSFKVLRAWGFDYKTMWFWRKIGRMGTGYWTRGEVEFVLVGVRGTVPAWRSSLSNWIEAVETEDVVELKPEGHSRKPEAVIRRIEALTLHAGARCELFATQHSAETANRRTAEPTLPGMEPPHLPTLWNCYGLELGHDFRNPRFWTGLIRGEPIFPGGGHEESTTSLDLSLDLHNPQEG